jgi:hypothetical protein
MDAQPLSARAALDFLRLAGLVKVRARGRAPDARARTAHAASTPRSFPSACGARAG